MKTATEELRQLLDDRGVKWRDCTNGFANITVFESKDIEWFFISREFVNPVYDYVNLRAERVAPAQAIDATLGRGECHDAAGKKMRFFSCSVCGGIDKSKNPEFCHWCGRKVKR